MAVALGACHMEVTGSHMIQAAVLCTALALLCATNIFATTSTWISVIIINNMDLGQVKDPMKGPMKSLVKDPMKGLVKKDPVKKDQAIFWSDCNQIGSGNVRLRVVPLFP